MSPGHLVSTRQDENAATLGKRPAAHGLMTQSTRKRAKAMSVALTGAPRADEAPAEAHDDAPRALEVAFQQSSHAAAARPASREVGEGAPTIAGAPVAKHPGALAAAVGTLFSPVYNLFAHAAGGGGEVLGATQESSGEECCTEDDVGDQHDGLGAVPGADTPDGTAHPQAVRMLGEDSSEEEVPQECVAAVVAEECNDEEDDGEDFDPLLFISTLPPLHECVPSDREPVLPRKARKGPLNTLVLDLDETLVHSTLEGAHAADFSFPVHFNNQQHTVNVRRRPALEAFLRRVAELFEVVIFTASQRVYAEQLLDIIDPGNEVFRHRVFRDSCVLVDGNYLKDLTVLGRDLARTIIVDNSPQAFGFQLDNGIPIESWFDDPHDRELEQLLPFLEQLADVDDVRPHICARFGLRQKVAASAQRMGMKLF